MKRRAAMISTAGIAALASTGSALAQGMGDRFGSKISAPEQEMGKEKHVPMIDAPATATAGEKIMVTVQVGKVVAHPNTMEHHIQSIELWVLEEGSSYLVKAASVNLGPTVADPMITVPVMLKANATLYAVEYCNIHGLWDNAVKVQVT